ncbi:unnamed protein product [Gordionus sp. m RMFG-2023]|uniref:calcineurin B homologous protein 1-like n=1 Tax=Gordionus sp. m RMFG-2023 TaxID=3053472 RepID=UPI0030E5982F
MGNKSTQLLQEEEIEDIRKETGFSRNQIVRLYSRFTNLDKSGSGALEREEFLKIPELAINPLVERIIHAFLHEGDGEHVNFRQFIRVLARFRPISKNKPNPYNNKEEKIRFAFNLYDLDRDDKISKEELIAILQMMVGENITPEQISSIANRTLAEVDTDHNNYITYQEFSEALEKIDVEQKMSIRFLG